jgi:hypothetical protein
MIAFLVGFGIAFFIGVIWISADEGGVGAWVLVLLLATLLGLAFRDMFTPGSSSAIAALRFRN